MRPDSLQVRHQQRVICRVGNYHGLQLPVDPQFTATFAENVLPVDKAAEFERDSKRLDQGTLTLEDFLRKWSPEKARDDVTLKAYIDELKAQRAEKAAQDAAAFGGGTHEGNGFLAGAGAGV